MRLNDFEEVVSMIRWRNRSWMEKVERRISIVGR